MKALLVVIHGQHRANESKHHRSVWVAVDKARLGVVDWEDPQDEVSLYIYKVSILLYFVKLDWAIDAHHLLVQTPCRPRRHRRSCFQRYVKPKILWNINRINHPRFPWG
jgi:hypothetical protein